MFVCEVIETKYALKHGQKDDDGNPLPLGSVQVRIGSHQSNVGQVRNVYARPAIFSKRIPLIGEQVLCFSGPANDWSSSTDKGIGFYYIAPINSTDDMVLHSFWQLWKRKGISTSSSPAQRLADKETPGYTFPKSPKKIDPLQPFEGDHIDEGRFGQSIRFGSTVVGDMSVYSKKPTWKGSGNADPLLILRVSSKSGAGNQYTVEDLKEDDASVYLTTKQSLNSLKGGFDKNLDVKQIGSWMQGSQIVADADRLVLNAKKDMLFLIGSKQVTVTGKKVLFQSDKYKVDLGELMDFLKKWLGLDADLANGKAHYSTPAGPTAVSTNMSQFIQLQTADFTKFKQP